MTKLPASALWISFTKVGYSKLYSLKISLLCKDFDLLRNSRPTVPMYADERELLVFRTFSQSGSVPKNSFRHAKRQRVSAAFLRVKSASAGAAAGVLAVAALAVGEESADGEVDAAEQLAGILLTAFLVAALALGHAVFQNR